MAMTYNKTYRVPTWVVLNKTGAKKQKKALQVLTEAGAKVKEWPAATFGEFLLTFRNKGYASHLPKEFPYFLDPALMLRAAGEHVKNVLGPTSNLSGAFSSPANRLNRKIESEADYERLFNQILDLEDPISLSQMFQIAENCHSGYNEATVFVTVGPVPKNLLTKVANKVITIGDDADNDIVTEEAKLEELEQLATKLF